MAGKFRVKKKERQDIRDVAKVLFYGGVPNDSAIEPLYKNWKYFFDLFLLIVKRESGDIDSPTNNSPHEQPYKTMQVMQLMQNLWIEKLIEDMAKNKHS